MEKDELHKKITTIYKKKANDASPDAETVLEHEKHFSYLFDFLSDHTIYPFFDVQKPWLVYWALNGVHILKESRCFTLKERKELADYVLSFQAPDGGFSGAVGFAPNMASSYAAVLALALLKLPSHNSLIDRKKMATFLKSCKAETPGAFRVHKFGEVDLRCTYIAMLLAKMLNIVDDELIDGVTEYVVCCQTFEGGIAPVPDVEAHGGYTFCGVAALSLLGQLERLNLKKLTLWLANMQTEYGGFCGRTNKLVDSCYSFWQGASFHIISDYFTPKTVPVTSNSGISVVLGALKNYFGFNKLMRPDQPVLISQKEEEPQPEAEASEKSARLNLSEGNPIYNAPMLQKYVLYCCQDAKQGGLKDKPTKKVDIYHTMYALSGLALASRANWTQADQIFDWSDYELEDIDPVYNIPRNCAEAFTDFFHKQ